MNILISNDDGFKSIGIKILTASLSDYGDTFVISPSCDISASSSCLSVHGPVNIRKVDDNKYIVMGTPADCVHIGSLGILRKFPDIVFSGINFGSNLGDDVVYSGINENKLDNFYYCTGDHTSSSSNSPIGASTMWSQKFFFEPDIGTQNDVKIKADIIDYKNSFKQRLKTNDNISTFGMSYTFSNISDSQTKSMIHFLENKGGYRRFEHQIPSVYNRPKVYYSPSWTHTWDYVNSNTLTIQLVEDPLGVVPTGT